MAGKSLLKMTSAAGADVLEPVSLRAEEAISAPFCFTVDMLATAPDMDADKVLGQPACVTLVMPSGFERPFHGIMRSFRAVGPGARGKWRYRAELVPKFWFASQTVDCRVFQKKTVIDILQALFTDNGVSDTSIKAAAGDAREYTVQYNETDYDFAVRLMEEEGYFWFFDHTSSAHTLVVADANTAFTNADLQSVRVLANGDAPDVLSSFMRTTATAIGKVKLADYDPLNPSTPVEGEQATILKTPGHAGRDVYRFPALTPVAGTATKRARLRQEAAEAAATLCDGIGRNHSLAPGKKFTIKEDRLTGGSDTIYTVHRIVHQVDDDADTAGAGIDSYSNSFDAFPNATKWRDWPQERRPHLGGIHTAIVVGNDGEEIHTDKYGRIKVRFFWDHRKDATAKDTIFIRVMQPWSGNTWGWQYLPRVGSEVGVAFVNGDPDSPIVIGSLYNAEQMPPFALPGQATKSGLRTRSSTKGGTSDFSEWSIDDKKGSELVFFHAQKDHTEEVENDHSEHIMHDQTLKVDNKRTHTVGKTEDITIGDAQTIKVGNGRTTTINKADDVLTVDPGNFNIEVTKGNMLTKVGVGNHDLKVSKGNIKTQAEMGNIDTMADMGNIGTKAKMGNILTEASLGDVTIKADAGGVSIEALKFIELKVGPSSLKLDMSGITLKGMTIKADASLMLDLKSDLMTTVKGGAMTMVKGAIVMIN